MKKQQLVELLAEYKEIAELFKVACEMYKEEAQRLREALYEHSCPSRATEHQYDPSDLEQKLKIINISHGNLTEAQLLDAIADLQNGTKPMSPSEAQSCFTAEKASEGFVSAIDEAAEAMHELCSSQRRR